MKPVGKVTHYYDKLGVAIVELQGTIKIGDNVRIEGKDGSFDQEIVSIHKNYEPVSHAGAGDIVGLKVEEKVSNGALVILV